MCLAVPGRVISLDPQDDQQRDGLMREGRVAFAGIVKRVNLACVPQVNVNDYVLVHAGFAITVVDEAAALTTLATLGLDDSNRSSDSPPAESAP